MNFWSRHILALIATCAVLLSTPFSLQFALAAEPLSIIGPNGQTNNAAKQYGPIKALDTLWSIAQKVKPDPSLTAHQVMAAIYDANPQAFSTSSYSSLEKGAILAIPSQGAMAQYPKAAPTTKKKAVPKKPSEIKPVASTSVPSAELKKLAGQSVQLEGLSEQLQAEKARSQRLSDELFKMQGVQVLSASDNQEQKTNIAELNEKLALLNDKLQASLIQSAKQKQALDTAQEQVSTLTAIELDLRSQSQANQPPTFWQSIMATPWLLAGFTLVPALLLIIAIWAWFIRRAGADVSPNGHHSNSANNAVTDPEPEPEGNSDDRVDPHMEEDEPANTHSSEGTLHAEGLDKDSSDDENNDRAIHLDSQAPDASFEALQNEQTDESLDPVEPKIEVDSSIDDLWAEVIEEHDETDLSDNSADNEKGTVSESVTQDNFSQTSLNADSYDEPTISASNNAIAASSMESEPAEEVANIPFNTDSHVEEELIEQVDLDAYSNNSAQLNPDEVERFFHSKEEKAELLPTDNEQPFEMNLNDGDNDSLILSASLADEIAAELENDIPQVDIRHLESDIPDDDELESLLAEFDNVSPIKQGMDMNVPLSDDPLLGNIGGLSGNVPDDIAKANAEQQEAMAESVSDIDALLAELEDEVVIVDPLSARSSDQNGQGRLNDVPSSAFQARSVKEDEALVFNSELDKFEQENSFIDINSLLNDEPERMQGRVDPYFESDIEIDELESLMGKASDPELSEQSMGAKLDLARAYMEIDDKDSARALLKEVGLEGDEKERREAGGLLNELVGL